MEVTLLQRSCIHAYYKDWYHISQDEFTVFERNRRTSARRHLFLLDQRLIITKEKDADGLYVFKDSLKVHSLLVAEKEGDNPNRFAVGTGTSNDWEQYYLLEASSAEKKQSWLQALKDIMKGQYDLLQGESLLAELLKGTWAHAQSGVELCPSICIYN